MAVKVKKIVLWRGEIENIPGALARALDPLAAAKTSLQVVMGYHVHGERSRAVIEAFPIAGKKASAAAGSVGLAASTLPALLVEGEDQPGLGHKMAQALGDAGININFLVAQVIKKKFSAVFGLESEADAKAAAALIKKAAGKKGKKGKK
jgi:hypothetical protein